MNDTETYRLTASDGLSWIEQHERNLGAFISIATRYNIDAMYSQRVSNNNDYPIRFYLERVTFLFNEFRKELRREVDKPENGRAFEIDLKDRFFPMIERYCQWYESYKEDVKKFEPDNYYKSMLDWILATKKEIEKYYPRDKNTLDLTHLDSNPSSELNGVQAALYYVFEGRDLPETWPRRKRQNYNKFNLSRLERQCAGKKKRSLTTRLSDFQKIEPLLSESGQQKLLIDKTAVLKELQSLEKY